MKRGSNPEYPARAQPQSSCAPECGFSLLELVVAMAVFMVVGGAAFALFLRQQPWSKQQADQVALNIGLRNATAQIQNDVVNAGTGLFSGANIPSWPVGVAITNNVQGSGSCYNSSTNSYSASCFDSISVVAAANLPVNPIHADGSGGCTTTNSSISTGDPAPGLTASQTAANYGQGDQLLFLSASGKQFTTVVLTGAATVSGSYVSFPHSATAANGSNTAANDPLGITTDSTDANNMLGSSFCSTDWIIKLAPITYSVDASDTTNPKLVRTQSGSAATVMEQVIGFKVGATIWNASNGTISAPYNYNAATYTNNTTNDEAYNFTLVRSVRISLIGRTKPSTDPNYTFRNSFDKGPYQIQGVGIVVNPRNMSMRD